MKTAFHEELPLMHLDELADEWQTRTLLRPSSCGRKLSTIRNMQESENDRQYRIIDQMLSMHLLKVDRTGDAQAVKVGAMVVK